CFGGTTRTLTTDNPRQRQMCKREMIIYYIILHRNEKSGKAKNPPPSFPRKRESRILMPQEFIKDGRGLKVWIPACAGI
ncbi:hypothetical protein COH78_11890, partial [Neisseria meningitidis]